MLFVIYICCVISSIIFICFMFFFFFKQKTAYEMRISDWRSDVCSSDLDPGTADRPAARPRPRGRPSAGAAQDQVRSARRGPEADRKSVVEGKSVSVRVDLGGRRIIKKKKRNASNYTYCNPDILLMTIA